MSTPVEADKLGELEFKWGTKRGIGGKNKDVRFYNDFTYDGMIYTLYDCVYMYKEDEPAPYIGKLVKIWENSDKSKKIKVQWFFRPSEIFVHLKDAELLENELFFASGDGKGLANINPLEAIAGKCNVVCISKDSRNPQPSAEELETAHNVFYRVFDVKSCTISDNMDDPVGGLEVKYVFNRRESVRTSVVPNHNPTGKEVPEVVGSPALRLLNNGKPAENENSMLEKEGEVEEALVKKGSLPGESPEVVNSSYIRKVEDIFLEKKNMLGEKTAGGKDDSEKDKFKDVKWSAGEVKSEERVKSVRHPGDLDVARPKKARLDCTSPLEVNDINCSQILSSPRKVAVNLMTGASSANSKSPSGLNKYLDVSGKDAILTGKSSVIDEKCPESVKLTKDLVGIGEDAKLKKDLNFLQGQQSKDSAGTEICKTLGEHLISRLETASNIRIVLPSETQCSGRYEDPEGSIQAFNIVKNTNASMSMPSNRSVDLSKGGTAQNDEYTGLANYSSALGGSTKKRGGSMENSNIKLDKLPRNNIPSPSASNGGDGKVESRTFEATRRPIIEKSNWMKLNWEDKVKKANDQGRLLLLQNLDPTYTSCEVEDVVWHAFMEECTAKLVQHTAISNPCSGQALVILKAREAVDRVLKKLDNGCLILPNKRPLVARKMNLPKFLEKQTTFVGHLAIDKARRQILREMVCDPDLGRLVGMKL